MGHANARQRDPSQRRHDPVQRLNDEHAEQLLDVARAFTGHPDAVAAHATFIDDHGVGLDIETPDGQDKSVHVAFAEQATGARRRLAFWALALRAAERLRGGRVEETDA